MMKYLSLSAAAILVILGGCSVTAPSVREYTIPPFPVKEVSSEKPLFPLSVRIVPPKTLPSLDSGEFHYLRADNENGVYRYSRWSDTPSWLITRALASSLIERHLFASVSYGAAYTRDDRVLESNLAGFYHRFHTDGSSEGYIDVTYRLLEGSTRELISAKRFIITHPAPTPDARGGVAAMEHAVAKLNEACAAWLMHTMKEKR